MYMRLRVPSCITQIGRTEKLLREFIVDVSIDIKVRKKHITLQLDNVVWLFGIGMVWCISIRYVDMYDAVWYKFPLTR